MNLKREKSFEQFLKLERNEDQGTEITLYISTGKETTELVDYTGQDIEQVIGIVEGVFKSINIDEVFDDEIVKRHNYKAVS